MLEQFVIDLPRGTVPRFGDGCAGCGEASESKLALPVVRDAERVIELPSCATCSSSHERTSRVLARSALLLLVLLAGLCLAAGMFQDFEQGRQRADLSAEHHEGYSEVEAGLNFAWYALSGVFGVLFIVGSWFSRDREPTVSVTCLGAVDRYAFLDAQAGRRFAKLNEAQVP